MAYIGCGSGLHRHEGVAYIGMKGCTGFDPHSKSFLFLLKAVHQNHMEQSEKHVLKTLVV